MAWFYVAIIVVSTVLSDLLQSWEMKRHGEVTDFGVSGIGRLLKMLLTKLPLIGSVIFLAISFYAFLALLAVADLSFAVPATALSLVAETILAGHNPGLMTASTSFLFLTNSASGDVSVLNIPTHRMVAVLPVGTDPGQVVITPDEVFALVLNRESGTITVLNLAAIQPGRVSAASALVTVIPVGSRPVSAAMHSV